LTQGAYELSNSSDPEIVAYFQQQKTFKDLALWGKKEALKLELLIQNQTHYVALTHAARQLQAKSSFHDLLRDPDPKIGDKLHVLIQCKRCKHPKTRHIDPAPLYEKATGRFVTRTMHCRMCPSTIGRYGRWSGSLQSEAEALDPMASTISKKYFMVSGAQRRSL